MLQTFQDNGLKFYSANAAGNPIGLNWDDRPYSDQVQLNQRNRTSACGYEYADFNDNISFVLWSDAAVTLDIYNSAGGSIAAAVAPSITFALGSETAYFFDIDLSLIAGIDNGSYIIANNSAEYLRTEPLYNSPNTLQVQYSNIYNNSITQNVYFPAFVKSAGVNQLDRVFATSANRFNRLVHSEKITRTIEGLALPLYKVNQLVRIFKNDNLQLIQATATTTTSDGIRLLEGGEIEVNQVNEYYNLYSFSASIVYDDSLDFTVN